jgi:hypothetical protein
LGQLSRDEAFLIGTNIAKLQARRTADIEGHSMAAKFGQAGRLSAAANAPPIRRRRQF